MITIDNLAVTYHAERQRDEDVFSQLFDGHSADRDEQRTRDADAEEHARCERSIVEGRDGW